MNFSYSKINTFLQCPVKFKYKYIDKISTPFKYNKDIVIGNLVHEILEFQIEKIPFDKLENFCNKIFFEKKNIYNIPCEEELILLKEVQAHIFSYYNFQKNIDNKLLEVEKEFTVSFENCLFTGRIDKIEQYRNEILICDYKTGNTPILNKKELKYNLQFTIYYLALKDIYNIKWFYFHYIKNSICYFTERNKSYIDFLKYLLYFICYYIQNNEYNYIINRYCNFCEYRVKCINDRKEEKISSATDSFFIKLKNIYDKIK